ncbi:MAG TPA: hypothetical protein VMX18_02250 [Candidatus Bipolaricaulota bacterium]|nr:hypothetical protein [Candidatus Bipolaricaulota bacterium]
MFDITWQFSWLDVLIGAIVIFVVVIILFVVRRRPPEDIDVKQIQDKWVEIESLISKDSEAMWRVAIIEADNLLDFVLKGMIMPGETLGQRLKVACYKYEKLRNVWWAHKLRNTIVHESDYKLRRGEAAKAIKGFEHALKILRVL